MAGNIRELMDDLLTASFDPSATYRASMRTLQAVMDGKIDNISPMNPVVAAIETQAALTAAFAEKSQADTRRLLQVRALTPEELYPHMADIHFTNIFNLPSSTVFNLVLNKNEILNRMVPVPGTQSKKLVIPRNTYFTIADYVFGLHYPVEIIQQGHGALRVVYDTDEKTPLQSLETNVVPFRTAIREGIEYLVIDLLVHQFTITSKTPTVTPATTFTNKTTIIDGYYATRVYRTLSNGTIEEIRVSYSEEYYDPLKPTAVVKINESEVTVTIPQIYINSGLILGELRIDVYTTKGKVDTNFSRFPLGSIGYRFRDLNKRASTTYSAPLQKLGTCTLLSEVNVTGGAMAMPFLELRDVVIADGIGDPSLPVTPAQIKNYLNRRGYDIIKNTDIVTDRVFLATRNMPDANSPSLLTSANASIETMNASFMDLIGNSAVIDNGTSVTISPKARYRLNSGVLSMVSDSELNTILTMRSDLLAAHVSNGDYLYSPYYYVLDKANDQFRLAAYYLDNPSIESQSFFDDNETTQLTVNTNGYTLLKTDTGFKMQVRTQSSDEYKELNDASLQCILGFVSPTENDPCWVLGTQISKGDDKERVFEFVLDSRFSMNDSDRIDFRNFKMYDMTQKTIYAAMEQEFTLIYATTTQMGDEFETGNIDAKLPRYLIETNSIGITEEKFALKFGDALSNLWTRARSIASSTIFETYPIDMILRYKEDVFKKDPATGSDIWFVDGNPQRILLHSAGDPVLVDGQQVVQYPAGSVVLDPTTGEPVVKGARFLKHRFELFLIEGVYAFSNDQIAIDYRNQVAQVVADWVTNDLAGIQRATMDKSNVYFYPKTVFGSIEVIVADGIIQQIPAAQSFDVLLSVPATVMANDELKQQLKKQTISTISAYLRNGILSHSELVEELRIAYGDDMIDVQITMFGSANNIPVMQLVNEIHRCGIRKRLISRDDEKLVVEEAVTVTYQTIA